MLNKSICKRCFNEHAETIYGDAWEWCDADDERWENEFIYCVLGYAENKPLRVPFNKAIKKCKYKLEHVVLNNA